MRVQRFILTTDFYPVTNKKMKTKNLTLLIVILGCAAILSSCSKRGCKEQCASNYSSKAEKEGHCKGCKDATAINYCPNVDEDDGSCLYERKFYLGNSCCGWFDVWVSDSTISCTEINCSSWCETFPQTQIGSLTKVYTSVPNCETADSIIVVTRKAGVYWYQTKQEDSSNPHWGCIEFAANYRKCLMKKID